ncbi:MAG: iron-containing redox enzyme family protein [Deltaproteobacteria bacterium]|nr:iron-containing redox enzyme family protein [Deltaproteobacteria bacterium]
MRKHSKEYTEPIYAALDQYRAELAAHPLLEAGRTGSLSTTTLHEFAFQQYSDSITWIPMLAHMKGKATRSPRLRAAIEDNIAHEAGLGGTSHVTLAVTLLRSLGITSLDAFDTTTFGATASMWLSDGFEGMAEPAVAGFLLAAEALVPQMFAAMKPSYDAVADANTRYFSEHIAVDADEHAAWMAEAVDEVVAMYGPESVPIVLLGMAEAWAETREVPDALWHRDGGGTCGSP